MLSTKIHLIQMVNFMIDCLLVKLWNVPLFGISDGKDKKLTG